MYKFGVEAPEVGPFGVSVERGGLSERMAESGQQITLHLSLSLSALAMEGETNSHLDVTGLLQNVNFRGENLHNRFSHVLALSEAGPLPFTHAIEEPSERKRMESARDGG